MVDNLTKYPRSKDRNYLFSIVIPSWNNLDYLKNCIESILQHSTHQHQIIVFINEGSDGTLEWLNDHTFRKPGLYTLSGKCRNLLRGEPEQIHGKV